MKNWGKLCKDMEYKNCNFVNIVNMEPSDLSNIGSKVRKERSFAKKELREAFPECYKILEKKG